MWGLGVRRSQKWRRPGEKEKEEQIVYAPNWIFLLLYPVCTPPTFHNTTQENGGVGTMCIGSHCLDSFPRWTCCHPHI